MHIYESDPRGMLPWSCGSWRSKHLSERRPSWPCGNRTQSAQPGHTYLEQEDLVVLVSAMQARIVQ